MIFDGEKRMIKRVINKIKITIKEIVIIPNLLFAIRKGGFVIA